MKNNNPIKYDIVMSIKPKYANMILDGSKKYEFRKHGFRKPIDKIFIYSTVPIKKIVGYFTFDAILRNTPRKIWEICCEYAGISEEDLLNYFKMTNNGYAIRINQTFKYAVPLSPTKVFIDFKVPRSFYYVDSKTNHYHHLGC